MTGRSRAALIAVLAASSCGRVVDDSVDAGADAASDDAMDATLPDALTTPDVAVTPPDASAPPIVACVEDAAIACPIPPSTCLDSQWLEYYDNGVCENGTCHFDVMLLQCTLDCFKAGCVYRPTTPNIKTK